MTLLSKKEFAKDCGMPTKSLAVYVLNKKVKYTDDGNIDIDIEPNKSFLAKYSRKAEAKGKVKPKLQIVKKEKVINEKIPKTENKNIKKADEDFDDEIENTGYSNLETEKLKQQVEKLKNENRKLSLSNEKTLGNFIPTEHAIILVTQLSEAIHLAWENELEDFILKFAAKNRLTRDEITELKKEKIKSTNLSRERAVKEAIKMLKRFQNEASLKRGVGEHD